MQPYPASSPPEPARQGPAYIPHILDIQVHVLKHFGISFVSLASDRRSIACARPRQIGMYLSCELTLKSLNVIGRAFNRDHSTVMHAHRKIHQLMQTDAQLAWDVCKITRETGIVS